jgi:hypothetical protein
LQTKRIWRKGNQQGNRGDGGREYRRSWNCYGSFKQSNDPTWGLIWGWRGPERIKSFMWMIAYNGVMNNEVRFARHLTGNPYCSICPSSVESILHVLRDCTTAQSIWKMFIKSK